MTSAAPTEDHFCAKTGKFRVFCEKRGHETAAQLFCNPNRHDSGSPGCPLIERYLHQIRNSSIRIPDKDRR